MSDREIEMSLEAVHRAELAALRLELTAVQDENVRLGAEVIYWRDEAGRLRRALDAVRGGRGAWP
jgi:hypothetical protein